MGDVKLLQLRPKIVVKRRVEHGQSGLAGKRLQNPPVGIPYGTSCDEIVRDDGTEPRAFCDQGHYDEAAASKKMRYFMRLRIMRCFVYNKRSYLSETPGNLVGAVKRQNQPLCDLGYASFLQTRLP